MHSWPERHPTWRYLFWSWDDIQLAVHAALPQYDHVLGLVSDHQMRLDIGRYAVLYLVGGVSIDGDVECVAPIPDQITIDHDVFFVAEDEIVSKILHKGRLRPDGAVLGSRPGHTFWLRLLDAIARRVQQGSCTNRDDCTGPNLIADVLDGMDRAPGAVLGPDLLHPTLPEADRIRARRVCKRDGEAARDLQQACADLDRALSRARSSTAAAIGIGHGIPDQAQVLAVASIADMIPPARLERPFDDPAQWSWWPKQQQ